MSSVSSPATRVRFVDPLALKQLLDDNNPNVDDPYNQQYRRVRDAVFAEGGAPDSDALLRLISGIDAFAVIEAAIASAGFVQGFDACRQLLLGELEVDRLAGGASDGGRGGVS
jgi:hypothetical protein